MPAVGSNNPQARQGGSWKGWSNFWAKHSGTWKKPLSVHVRSGGSWVKVWDERPAVTSGPTNTYFLDNNAFPPIHYYTKSFTIQSNGFQTTMSATSPSGIVSFNQSTTVSANTSQFTEVVSEQIGGSYDSSGWPTVTATNSSGSITF